jgi:hypothetical protein
MAQSFGLGFVVSSCDFLVLSCCLRRCGVLRVFFDSLIASTSIFDIPSYKVPTVDALATRTDEGRGWLRKATGSRLPGFDP